MAKRIAVYGKVQGVFFRVSTKEQADKLGLKGWVRNEPDGSVLIEVCGESEIVEQLIEWCNNGPMLARVDEVIVSDISTQYDSGFSITS